jgi:ligand-binding SRPBCC domain-containing protein
MPELVLITDITAPVAACFALSLSVDAHTSSMETSGERIFAGVRSGAMTLGDTTTWQARHFGISFRMTSKITEYEPSSRFVDEQISGPFAQWWHEHRFEGRVGHTLMTDVVRFRSPAGPVGQLVDRIVLQGYMTRLLAQRNVWLKEQLEGG